MPDLTKTASMPNRHSSTPARFWKPVLGWLDRLAPGLTFVGVLAVWQLGVYLFRVPIFLLPAPSDIAAAAFETEWWLWGRHIWATLRVALEGYLLATVIAIPLGVMLATSRLLSRTLYPLLIVIQSMPVVAIAPIIVVTLGSSDLPRIVITFLITFFPIVVSTATGVAATPPELIELSRSLRAGRGREITQIRLPFALPYIFSALKISTTLAVVGAVVAEFVAADQGLGYFIAISTSFFRIPSAFMGLVILVVMSLGLFQLVVTVQRIFAPWSLPTGGTGH